MMNESIHTIMTPDPICVGIKTSLAEIFEIVLKKNIHSLPVVEKGKIVGLITSNDLAQLISNHADYNTIFAEEVMSRKFATLSPDDKIGTAAELLLDRRFKALPVLNNMSVVGIVTSYDVLRYEFKREYRVPILYKEVFDLNYRAAM